MGSKSKKARISFQDPRKGTEQEDEEFDPNGPPDTPSPPHPEEILEVSTPDEDELKIPAKESKPQDIKMIPEGGWQQMMSWMESMTEAMKLITRGQDTQNPPVAG